jgi:flagellin
MAMINSNISALVANNAIKQNDRLMSSNMEKLATGFRINSAKDGAAGLAIALRMKSQISGLNMAVRNVNDAISMLQTAEGATKEITGMLGRMHELAIQASSETYTSSDRAALNLEYQALLSEIDSIAETTEWNGDKILAGADHAVTTNLATSKSVNIQAGTDASQTMGFTLNSWRPTVAVDGSMSVDGTDGTGVDDSVPEQTVFDFNNHQMGMGAGSPGSYGAYTVGVGGLSAHFIAEQSSGTSIITATMIAEVFANLEAGATEGAIASNTVLAGDIRVLYSGKLVGFTSSAVHDSTELTFTSVGSDGTPNSGNVDDILITKHTGSTGHSYYQLQSTNHLNTSTTTTDGGTGNQGAYGSGILYAGGNLALGGGTPLAPTALNLTSVTNATAALSELEKALDGASAERAKYGAYLNRLEHAANNISNIAMNTSASLSQIKDTDYALEAAELARAQIISQASSAMLSQANQSKQTVLALLRE